MQPSPAALIFDPRVAADVVGSTVAVDQPRHVSPSLACRRTGRQAGEQAGRQAGRAERGGGRSTQHAQHAQPASRGSESATWPW